MTPGSWETEARPERVPADPAIAQAGTKLTTVSAARKAIETVLEGDERVFSFEKSGFSYNVVTAQ